MSTYKKIVFFGASQFFMKSAVYLSIFLILSSCDYFETEKVTADEILQEELQSFNWNEVDQYPTFDNCNSITDKVASKQCFENTLRKEINRFLGQQIIIVDEDVSDTIILTIEIDKTGNLGIQKIDMSSTTRKLLPQLDSLLHHSFDSLPKVYPAIKRNQQVTTQFQLPIQLKIE